VKLFSKIQRPLDEYLTLYYAIKNLATNKHMNGLLIYGPPGTGKTFTVKYTLYKLDVPYVHYKGGAKNLEDLVSILYKHRKGKVIILDDFDSALNNPDAINILKAATDTYETRIISLPMYRDTGFSDIDYHPYQNNLCLPQRLSLLQTNLKVNWTKHYCREWLV